jgi:dTDP-4-amino-4,6-dideoxygalactose transaminase
MSQQLEQILTSRYAAEGFDFITTNNATSGLSACLLALREKNRASGNGAVRNKVVIPGFTFPATLQAVLAAGFEPIVCDVSMTDCFIDEKMLSEILAAQSGEIAALMPVRVYGFNKSMAGVLALADKYAIPVVVDAAAALPAGNDGIRYGASHEAGYFEVFSFHATKVFAIGEGGAICCPQAFKLLLRQVMNFGLKDYASFITGFNGKMDEFAAARGVAMADIYDDILAKKQTFVARYHRLFAELGHNSISLINPYIYAPHQSMPVYVADKASELQAACEAHGIGARIYYTPSMDKAIIGSDVGDAPVSHHLSQSVLCLPVYSRYTEAELDDIMNLLQQILSDFAVRLAA